MSLLDAPRDFSHSKRKAADTLPEGLPLRLVKRARNNDFTDEEHRGGSAYYPNTRGAEHVLGAMASVATSELSTITLPALPPLRSMFPPPTTLSISPTKLPELRSNPAQRESDGNQYEEEFVLNSVDLDFDPESDDMDDLDGEMWASKMLFCISHNVQHHGITNNNSSNTLNNNNSTSSLNINNSSSTPMTKKEEVVLQELPPPVVTLTNNNTEQAVTKSTNSASSPTKDRSNNNTNNNNNNNNATNSSPATTTGGSTRNLRPSSSSTSSSSVPTYSRPVSHFSSCSSSGDAKKGKKKKRRGHFPKATTDLLKQWLFEHLDHPYPTEEEKAMLAEDTGLSVKQINYWFTNSRRRFLKKGVE